MIDPQAKSLIEATADIANTQFVHLLSRDIGIFNGTVELQDKPAGTLYPTACELTAHGITAQGQDFPQAARNWRRIATWLGSPTNRLALADAQLCAWSIEAMNDPDIIARPDLLKQAAQSVKRLAPITDRDAHICAQLVIAALPEPAVSDARA